MVAYSLTRSLQAIWTQLALGNLDFKLNENETTKRFVVAPSVTMCVYEMDITIFFFPLTFPILLWKALFHIISVN